MRNSSILPFVIVTCFLLSGGFVLAQPNFVAFESGQVRPLAISPDGNQLFVVNTPDNQLEIFDINGGTGMLTRAGVVQVGMEPVAVAARSNNEVWVVNFLSDSVSVIDLSGASPRVVRTLLVGDEPSDIVFAGASGERAFITSAHRGQNSPYPQGEYNTSGIGRADVWVFDANALGTSLGGDEIAIIELFSDKPRALAATADGSTVYAAAFHSGNQTMALSEGHVCNSTNSNVDSGTVKGSCSIGGETAPGGKPLPHKDHNGVERPETGLILKFNRDGGTSNQWQDELGRNWNNMVKFNLPDRDVFEIDADAPTPVAIDASSTCSDGSGCWAGVGTVLFNMAINPLSGKIYVSNTDAQNHVRFEGPGTFVNGTKPPGEPNTVQGNLALARITVLDGSSVDPIHLNKHINYAVTPAAAGVKDDSLATPTQMAVSPDGLTLYVAALGSDKIGIFDTAQLENDTFTPDAANHITLSGGGPTGIVLHNNGHLYVMTRFNNSVAVIDTGLKAEVQTLALHNPEPADLVAGRPFLYSAQLTSSNGEASCSSCHIFGDLDSSGWDLGNPDDDLKVNSNVFNGVVPSFADPLAKTFHPMKGPMATQSLRGLVNAGPQHWRGDREGDAVFSFNAFNPAMVGLVGRASELTPEDMQAFTDFAMQLTYPPNPSKQLDNSFRAGEAAAMSMYANTTTDLVATCNQCHVLDPASGFFGGDGRSIFDGSNQHLKIPHLRNLYQKVGMFGMAEIEPPEALASQGQGSLAVHGGSFANTGNQVRGFGFLHDGSVDSLERFFDVDGFQINSTPLSAGQRSDMRDLMISFPTDLAPIVGQQVTLTNSNAVVANPRIDLLIARADTVFTSEILGGVTTECELIAKGIAGGSSHGYLYLGGGSFQPDDGGAPISDANLRLQALGAAQEVTYTCVPPGSGMRMGIDRDGDTLTDGVESGTGVFVSALDTGTSAAMADTDGDGFDDGEEVLAGTDPNNALSFPDDPIQVPGLHGTLAIAALASSMIATAVVAGRRRRGMSQG
jgi:DNA-binding beta-propeller fold protein YncE